MTELTASSPAPEYAGEPGATPHVTTTDAVPDVIALLFRRDNVPSLLTATEERRLAERLADGDTSAGEHLVVANLRLVLYIAKAFTGRGLPLEDLIQEGTLGLMTAVQKFDPMLGYRFATYAVWWIRQGITRAVAEQSRSIRLPVHVGNLLKRANESEQELTQRLGRTPTTKEIAAEIDIPAARLTEFWRHRSGVASLDQQVNEDGGPLVDTISSADGGSTEESSAEKSALDNLRAEAVRSLVEALDPREQVMISKRFGLSQRSVGECSTLGEIARELQLSPERIRQIERAALAKLRQRALRSRHRRAIAR